MLNVDIDTYLLTDLMQFMAELRQIFSALFCVCDHHHVKKAVDYRLRNIKNVDLIVGQISADFGNDANSIFSYNCYYRLLHVY